MLLSEAEGNTPTRAKGKRVGDLAQSETLCMWRRSSTGTWEISFVSSKGLRGRVVKAKAERPPCTRMRSRTRP